MEGLEIDFLYVESGERSGDAIAFRYGNFLHRSLYKVIIIDGGTLDSGQKLVDLIRGSYNTEYVDLVVCTHPDADHASGLRVVLESLSIGELWLHQPWDHSKYICHLFQDGRLTPNSLDERLRDAYSFAHELEVIANRRGISIREPFKGRTFDNGKIRVLGPSTEYYRELIPDFGKTPEAKSIFESVTGVVKKAINWVIESLDIETLDESGITSAENNSSSVLLFLHEEGSYLFTGDAGIPALKNVVSAAEEQGIQLKNLVFLQVPHHGSRRNVSPTILNSIMAPTSFISASKDSEKHPSKKVTNALNRRGSQVYTTNGFSILHRRNVPMRPGYSPISSVPFYYQVEE